MLRGVAEHPWVVFVDQPRGFRGELSASGLVELVQVVALTTADGALHVETSDGAGTLWFEAGAIVHALCEGERGAAAFLRMLRWPAGSFRVDKQARAPERSIDWSTTQLLLEGARVLDEQRAGDGPEERAAE
jgi:Domain of unknown function (DUF4388)